MKHIKGIIFDIDGTLIPESDVLKAQADAVAWKFGSSLEEQQQLISAFFSVNTEEAEKQVRGDAHQKNNLTYYFTRIAKELNVSLSDDECEKVVADWSAAFGRAHTNPTFFNDVIPTLTALKEAGYTLYIASGSTLENRQALLAELGIIDFFREVFAASTIGFQKQDEQFWKHVLKNIEYTPDELLVVGNQVNDDVLHPHHLGMYTVLVQRPEMLSKNKGVKAVEPDSSVSTLKDILQLL